MSEAEFSQEQYDRVLVLAGRALSHACARDWHKAASTVRQIASAGGGEGLAVAMSAWADAVISVRGEPRPGQRIKLSWREAGAERIQSADDVDPAKRWAGQFIAARAALDRPMCDALFEAIPERESSVYVMAVLNCASATIGRLS